MHLIPRTWFELSRTLVRILYEHTFYVKLSEILLVQGFHFVILEQGENNSLGQSPYDEMISAKYPKSKIQVWYPTWFIVE